MSDEQSSLPLMEEEPVVRKRTVMFADILRLTCERTRVSEAEMKGRKRHRDVSIPRQVIMYLAVEDTRKSTVWIGKQLGGRDHTTVIHGKRNIADLIASGARPDLAAHVVAIRARYPTN